MFILQGTNLAAVAEEYGDALTELRGSSVAMATGAISSQSALKMAGCEVYLPLWPITSEYCLESHEQNVFSRKLQYLQKHHQLIKYSSPK